MSDDKLNGAIENIESIISVMINDMSMGASYVRTSSSPCLDMIMLKKELEARKAPVKKKK
ncbi:MAG: hypothetical protein H8D23_11770 [Candidatus Brocadiales bacterium]|nr:hypothetical protein [Candidatus Brocadiales bacterium]